jgi:parvulin-like peptidyl-prolyl isomerase
MEPNARENQLRDWSTENVLERIILTQQAQKKIHHIPEQQTQQAYQQLIQQNPSLSELPKEQVIEDLKTQLKLEKLLKELTADITEPSEKEIKKYYEKNIDRFTIPPTVHAAHIVIHPDDQTPPEEQKQKIQNALDEIKQGADFTEVAKKYSHCPEQGGDLGYFPKGKMVPEFEEVVFNMQPGQISDIFQTQFGYHIAKVFDKKPKTPCQLDYAKDLIVKEIKENKKNEIIEKFIDKHKKNADIETK